MFLLLNRHYQHIKNVSKRTIFPLYPFGFFCFVTISSDIIGQAGINQIFLLQKNLFCYKLNHDKSGLFLKLEVGSNIKSKVICKQFSPEGVNFWQEVYFEQAEFL